MLSRWLVGGLIILLEDSINKIIVINNNDSHKIK